MSSSVTVISVHVLIVIAVINHLNFITFLSVVIAAVFKIKSSSVPSMAFEMQHFLNDFCDYRLWDGNPRLQTCRSSKASSSCRQHHFSAGHQATERPFPQGLATVGFATRASITGGLFQTQQLRLALFAMLERATRQLRNDGQQRDCIFEHQTPQLSI